MSVCQTPLICSRTEQSNGLGAGGVAFAETQEEVTTSGLIAEDLCARARVVELLRDL